MKAILTLFLLLVSSTAAVSAEHLCPVCEQAAVKISQQKDDHSKPSKNLAVWNRSSCANPFYGTGSYICATGGYAFEAGFKTWKLSLNDRDQFAHPLTRSIHQFPLPVKSNLQSGLVYSQEFDSLKSVKHSLNFWCATDDAYFERIQTYGRAEGLSLSIERKRATGQSIVRAAKRIEQDRAD